MLSASATRKTTEGVSRLNPSDLSSAIAHTASRTPDATSTSHDITHSYGALLSRAAYDQPSTMHGPHALVVDGRFLPMTGRDVQPWAGPQIFVIDVAGGDKVPRKGGPGITRALEPRRFPRLLQRCSDSPHRRLRL